MKNNIIRFVVVSAFLPMLAFAQTVTDTVSDQIDCAVITHALKLGSKDASTGGDVTTLQTYLSQANFLDADPTGYFGRATRKAVQDFQRENGITPLGSVGPYTRTKIKEISCTGSNTNTTSVNTEKPLLRVINVHSQGPATITVAYENLPKNTKALAVCLKEGSACTEWVVNFTPLQSGEFTLTQDQGSTKGLGDGEYKIVAVADGFKPLMESNTFIVSNQTIINTVTNTTNTSQAISLVSVKITSPNGGTSFKHDGSPISVTWESNNIPATQRLDFLRLRSYQTGQEYNLATNVLNDGQEVVTIPTSVPLGAYTLEIKAYVNGTLVTDSSDTYFKLVDSDVTVALSATPSSVTGNQKTLIEWKSTNANECYFSLRNQSGSTPFKKESAQMSDDMSFGVTTTMDVYCVGSNGKSDTKSVTINVTPDIQ